MRDYETEARELEIFLNTMGLLKPELSITQMVLPFLPKVTMAQVIAHIPKVEPKSFQEMLDELPDLHALEAPISHTPTPELTLSEDQEMAWTKMRAWANTDKPYFILKGYAGTGKTFLLRLLGKLQSRVYYSAPTNKAAKVLGKSVGSAAKTTYAMLGLRMEQVEDELILTPSGTPPYFPKGSILVIDESSMSGRVLCKAVEEARIRCKLKILYVGDPMQLPPPCEKTSKAWSATRDKECIALMKKVMRNDNQLLALATALRLCIRNKDWWSPLKSDHDETGGVWKWKNQNQFERCILQAVDEGFEDTKVIAWRNTTVNYYNKMIRKRLGFHDIYNVGELILIAEPIEEDGVIIAHTDDEYKIVEIEETTIRSGLVDIEVWQLQVQGDQSLILNVAKDQSEVDNILARKARVARKAQGYERKAAWKDFWDTKSKFHKVRYGYALTAHRAQGSTYTRVFVDQMDILSNRSKREAFRCLYVATTRPTTRLDSY